jgi:hypothetical protein
MLILRTLFPVISDYFRRKTNTIKQLVIASIAPAALKPGMPLLSFPEAGGVVTFVLESGA